MDKKSKAVITIFFVLLLVSMGLTYWRTMVVKSFDVVDSSASEVAN